MSYATESLKKTLHYDKKEQTLLLSTYMEDLADVRKSLRMAFKQDDVSLTQVKEVAYPGTPPTGTEYLCLQGVANAFGYARRDIYIEFGVRDGKPQTLLLLVPLPEKWNLSTAFGEIPEDQLPAGGKLTEPVIVISHGLSDVEGKRKIQEHDKKQSMIVDLSGYPLQDGLQIFASGVVDGENALGEATRKKATDAGLPADLLPPAATGPKRVEVRADRDEGWLVIEKWWDCPLPPTGFNQNGIHAIGLATRFSLKDSSKPPYTYWLQEIGTFESPIVLEAQILEMDEEETGQKTYYPVRYSSQLGSRIALNAGNTNALTQLLGDETSTLFNTLGLTLPSSISLSGLTYAPQDFIQLVFAAGDATDSQKNLVKVGPFDLEEVDFTLYLPLNKTPITPQVELEGRASIWGEQFRIHAKPWTLLEGGLDDPDGIKIGQFIQEKLRVPLPFDISTLTLRRLWLTHFLDGEKEGAGTTSLAIGVTGKVNLLPGADGAVVFDGFDLDIDLPGEESAEARLSADFELGPLHLTVMGTHESDSWTFNGTVVADGEGFPLTQLVDHLVHHFGAAVPDEIPDIKLETVSLSYETATHTLSIHATADWTIPDAIPVLNGKSRVILSLTLAQDPDKGGKKVALSFEWDLEKTFNGNTYTLDAQADYSSESQFFGFDFRAPDHNPLKLIEDVGPGLGLDTQFLPAPVTGVLDTIFEVSTLSVNYARPGNAFDIAWTRPFPSDDKGMLLMEYSQESAASAPEDAESKSTGNTQRALQVSWIGIEQEDAKEGTVGINDVLGLVGQPDLFDDLHNLLNDVGLSTISDTVQEILTFRKLGFSWTNQTDPPILTLTAESTYREKTDAFVAVSFGEQKSFVAGVAFPKETENTDKKDAVKSLFQSEDNAEKSPIEAILNVVETILEHIELTHLLVSTVDSKTYQPPAFVQEAMQPSFERTGMPALPSKPFGSSTMSIAKGLSVGVRVTLGIDSFIRKVIDFDELDGQFTIGTTCALQISLPEGLKLDAGGGNKLVLQAPALRIQETGEIPEIDIVCGVDLQLFGQHIQASGWVALSEESITGHIQIQELTLPLPALQGVQLVINSDHPLSLEVGLQFEPPGLELGMQGAFKIYKDEKDFVFGYATFVLEIIEEVPNVQYVSFALDEMSIPVLLEAITGVQYKLHLADEATKMVQAATEIVAQAGPGETASTAHAAGDVAKKASATIELLQTALGHLEAIMEKVELTDVSLHWSDTLTNLPDGTTVMPGVGMRGGLKIFDWNAFAMLDISTQGVPSIMGHFEAGKIEIADVLRIWGDGQGLRKAPKTGNDIHLAPQQKIEALTEGKPTAPLPGLVAADEGSWYLDPGGPVLHFSSRSSPFLYADLHAELFGALHADIHAEITDEGFSFDFKVGAGNVVSAELECHWWHKEGRFEAHGNLGVLLKGDIGPLIPGVEATRIHLDTMLDAHASLVVDSTGFLFNIHGAFVHEGLSLTVPELTITVSFKSLEDLAKLVWQHIVDAAKEIFKEILLPIGKFIENAAVEVAHVAVAAAEEVSALVAEGAAKANAILEDAGKAAEQEIDQLQQSTVALVNKATDIAANALNEAQEAAKPLIDEAGHLIGQASQLVSEAAVAIKALADEAAVLLDEAAHYAAQVAMVALREVAVLLDEARRWVGARLEQAAALVRQIAEAARAIVQSVEAEIDEVENEINNLSRKLEDLLSSAEHTIASGASSVWHWATS